MKIKVCGMREAANIKSLMSLKPDFIGFIFYPLSARFAGDLTANDLTAIDSNASKVGVFVNDTLESTIDKILNFKLDAVQLHGEESPAFCRDLKTKFVNEPTTKEVKLIKAFGLDEHFDFSRLEMYDGVADFFLFDTKTSSFGGSGQTFNWEILKNYQGQTPYFLSGGLSADNIELIKTMKDPRLFGVDLNSRFELAPGVKDIEKLKCTFDTIRDNKSFDDSRRI